MATECITIDQVTEFVSKDTNRIQGKIAEVLALRSPFMDILGGGTLSNVSDVVRSVVQERAALATSLAKPVFTNDTELCGQLGSQDEVGTTEYQYRLQSLRGMGPPICVKLARTAFKDSYLRAQQALERAILQIMNADIRSTLHMRSGVKYVVNSHYDFYTNLTGDAQQIDTQFSQHLPNGKLTFQTLYKLGTFLKEEMLAAPFEGDGGQVLKFIGSSDIVEALRNDLQVKVDLQYLATGRYELGGKSLQGYTFQGPYRGFVFGIDQQPLRSNGFNGSGDLVLIEPETNVAVTNGQAARRNPAWTSATYEVAFLMADDSFERLVPESFTGEASVKFSPQLNMGQLDWWYIRDRCNAYGDFGQHLYQISRAYRPIRPQNVIPILYKRCVFDGGVTYCSAVNGI